MIEEALKNKNYATFKKKLESCGVDISQFDEKIGDKLLNATFSLTNENGTAYDGSFIQIVLRTLTPYAIRINDLLPENIRVDQSSLVKVCLLSQLSKCEMFVKNTNQWEIDNRNMLYKYGKYYLALKMGMRSIVLCESLGIKFTPNEMEAMIIFDRNSDDKQTEFYSSTLATILKEANDLTNLQFRMDNGSK